MNGPTNQPPQPTRPESSAPRIAGIDYGTVRIGIAIADLRVAIASPYENYRRVSPDADAHHFRRLVAEEAIGRFVVGLPVHLSGHESGKSVEARRFGAWLGEVTGVPIEFFDERLTTVEAESHLIDARLTRKQRRARLDKLAAQIMLSAYLESRTRGGEGIEPL